jgi:spermidine/putrescine transport system permease protein
MQIGPDPLLRTASSLSFGHAIIWLLLLGRWLTFSSVNWTPFEFELLLADMAPLIAYLVYGGFLAADLAVGFGLRTQAIWARRLGIVRATVVAVLSVVYFLTTSEFYGAAIFLGLSGLLLVLELRNTPWALSYPAAFWLGVFFITPMFIVFIVSLGERSRLGTVIYPEFSFGTILAYFDDYGRFFSTINGEYIYLRILGRSVWLAVLNTIFCLLVGFPFAYWIARRPAKQRYIMVFLVMIPFWTNFLVRTYAWMLILRDSGLINGIWTITLHDQAVLLADRSAIFAWLAEVTSRKLPLLFTQPAVFLGLFYGYLPFMVLPLYSTLEKVDWSLLEAAADLGANTWQSTTRILFPLTIPGIVAGSIIVFIPSLGAYVTPDLMGGAKVSLLGNLLQQQFMTVRDWPFGSAIGFIMMAIMLLAVLIYFRSLNKAQESAQ